MERRKITYKIYPSRSQQETLFNHLRLHRQLYNGALEERISAYDKAGLSIQYNDQQKSFTEIRRDCEAFRELPIFAARMTLRRLDKAVKAFFRRVQAGEKPGFPRFKGQNSFTSFEMCCHGQDWEFKPNDSWKHGKLFIKGIGWIKARGQARTGGDIKTSQVMYRRGGWWLSVTVECEPERASKATGVCGIDWGVEYVLTIAEADGAFEQIKNPRWYKTGKSDQLALEQALARKKKRSRGWKKAKGQLARFKGKQAAKRRDFNHKLSARLAQQYALIVNEKLQISNMTRSAKGTVEKPGKLVPQKAGLNREILDTAPSALIDMIRYKASEAGNWYIESPTRQLKPSQRCPSCWSVLKKTLNKRWHSCECGVEMPRDAASAWVNVLWGIEQMGWEPLPVGSPTETATTTQFSGR